jgi:hypothetical protein
MLIFYQRHLPNKKMEFGKVMSTHITPPWKSFEITGKATSRHEKYVGRWSLHLTCN